MIKCYNQPEPQPEPELDPEPEHEPEYLITYFPLLSCTRDSIIALNLLFQETKSVLYFQFERVYSDGIICRDWFCRLISMMTLCITYLGT